MTSQPNILWICSDQQRWDTLGCYGNRFVKSPHIDGLARRGVLFDNAFCQNPVCTPSRASFLTGRYPRTCRARQNGQSIPPDELTVTKLLADAGYVCGLSGKLHLSPCNPIVSRQGEHRIDDGYHVVYWSHHPERSLPAFNHLGNAHNLWLAEHGIRLKTNPCNGCEHVRYGMPEEWHHSTWCTDMAMAFIDQAAHYDQPWLFSINYFDPHHPFDPPREYLDRYLDKLNEIPLPSYIDGELEDKSVWQRIDSTGAYGGGGIAYSKMSENDHRMVRAAYWAMCDLLDVQVGRLLDKLDRTGQRDNTIVIYGSDHGEMLGDHGIYLKGPYFYEPAVHVPLIIDWPGHVLGGSRIDALTELIDLAPTLLDAAGLPVFRGMQGRSLLAQLSGEHPETVREDVYCEFYGSHHCHEPSPQATMIRTGRYKLVRWHGFGGGELYDLQADPGEHRNLWQNPDYASIRAELHERLCDRMAATIDPLPDRISVW